MWYGETLEEVMFRGNIVMKGYLKNKAGMDEAFLATLQSIRRGIDACAESCNYFEVCKGGLPSNKLGEHGTFEATETIACKFKRQAVTDAVVELLIEGNLRAPGRSAQRG